MSRLPPGAMHSIVPAKERQHSCTTQKYTWTSCTTRLCARLRSPAPGGHDRRSGADRAIQSRAAGG
ncbi:hypothetical protein PHLGIDRAFT_337559 [Phlebiopsis gigantea 11061_1 CR5-6]|uniref:Uncharacterized protein n=1 Tax=Phlebiopsis gigantea (strain 11061_1 CR5-6) TaxID=745531 RepID=A0A0C3PA94_PHLG1|nr:hypothetical protein PHLGIDRAFT_337559 [Phlebiopsis gigantea 11061_1 CR5-6]